MNCVHKPGSRTMSKKFDSGKYRVEPGQKTGRVHSPRPARAPAAPAVSPASLQRARSPSAQRPCLLSQYSRCSAIHPALKPLPQLLCHDTISLYQDTAPQPTSLPTAIQLPLSLQYKPLYCNTKTHIPAF